MGIALGAAVLAASVLAGGALAAPGDVTVTRVADIHPTTGSSPADIVNVGGTALFAATDAVNGTELWKSNGGPLGPGAPNWSRTSSRGPAPRIPATWSTSAARSCSGHKVTRAIRSSGRASRRTTRPPPPGSRTSTLGRPAPIPSQLAAVGGALFFSADDGVHGVEAWRSKPPFDGDSTDLVDDLNVIPPSRPLRSPTSSPRSAARSCSRPTTASTEPSCSRARAPLRHGRAG